METTLHIHPTADLAERVLLPGDPGRALLLAQSLLERPKMFNHNRGLWGYTGAAADGAPLTIQSTGMGGPSAAIVVEELVRLGARRIVRVGSCGALRDGFELGDAIVATEAIAGDGASRALGAGARVAADGALTAALAAAADAKGGARRGAVLTTDLFYDPAGAHADPSAETAEAALAIEMETATLFQLGALRGVQTACALVVSDLLGARRGRIDADAMEAAAIRLGRIAVTALG
ncbi:purine-nucleoside phosphorylase [Conexibacter arvalis]|uniref:Uridine phosphorylase n=1 Tax=Conexibacter arvalis TaxID=912552 RepID=A0A840IF69_9ACTN|nr:purine-nucleoside phosphorylase [Conexibacter arvalis]MBB4662638.1 DeoD family purine-nucleoside phosphorylase [Conexibacter arvalis]